MAEECRVCYQEGEQSKYIIFIVFHSFVSCPVLITAGEDGKVSR